MAATVEQLEKQIQGTQKTLDGLGKALDTITTKLEKMPAAGSPHPQQVFGVPNLRMGEDMMSSRGYSFLKMLGVVTGQLDANKAKIERDIADRLHRTNVADLGSQGYSYAGSRPGLGTFLAPLATNYLMDDIVPAEFRREMKSLVRAGVDGADQDHMAWIRRKQLAARYGGQVGHKALSWLNELTGGALVAPPEMGELIELLRNKEALTNAGAKTVPLPPQGRMKYPRQTSASTTYWVGESRPIADSNIGTGEITLQAKKLAVMIKAPNELIRFASPAAESLMRDDMTKSLALALDLAGLEGQGSDNSPRGIINYPNINNITSADPQVNGDRLVGPDMYRMIAACEESNAECEGFIMRPKTLWKFFSLRTDAVAQGDRQGPFLFNLIRDATEDTPATLAGLPVTKSTQVSQSRAKGSATNLTYILGGMWSEVLIGMFGAIEFAATTMGDTAFTNDQTWVRGILSADIQLRHEASFVLLDNLDVVNLS